MMAIERSEVRFGLTAIPYMVRRSQRRGTVSHRHRPVHGRPADSTPDHADRAVGSRGT